MRKNQNENFAYALACSFDYPCYSPPIFVCKFKVRFNCVFQVKLIHPYGRLGREQNKTVTINEGFILNGAIVPKLYGQQFSRLNLNAYQWYQERSADGLGMHNFGAKI